MQERKLLDQVSDLARLRHLSLRTEQTYRNWIKRFILFHRKRHPRELDAAAVRDFLTHLAVHDHVAAATQNQAFNALLFLYKQVLQIDLPQIENVERAQRSRRLPVVFTKAEARAVISHMKGARRLIAGLLYGSGLRIMEAVRLRIKDIDFEGHTITVRDAKGEKQRVTVLPQALDPRLRAQVEAVRKLHQLDLQRGYGDVYLPYALSASIRRPRETSSGSTFFQRRNIRSTPALAR